LDFPAFIGRDLTPKGFIELDPDSSFCSLPSSIEENQTTKSIISIFPNPVYGTSDLTVRIDYGETIDCSLYSIHGRPVMELPIEPGESRIPLVDLQPGIYTLVLPPPLNQVVRLAVIR
jgi:hypothetical protein